MATTDEQRVVRPVPYDLDAESSVLGALILERDAIVKVSPILEAGDFYRDANGAVYGAILALYARREPPDPVILAAELKRQGLEELTGGISGLITLVNATPSAVHVEYYARIVAEKAVRRRYISMGGEIAALGYQEDIPVDEMIAIAQGLLLRASTRRSKEDYVSMRVMADEFLDHLEYLEANPGTSTGVTSGLRSLDNYTGGFQKSDLIVLAARPGIGKTSMALGIAYAAAQEGHIVGINSLEMNRGQLIQRLAATETGIDSASIRTGRLTDHNIQRLHKVIPIMAELPIHVDHTSAVRITDLRATAHRLKATTGLDILIVDYLQLVSGTPRKDQNRVQEINEISRGLKQLARELDVPVLACAQLSRESEQRGGGVPRLSDLAEGSSIEKDSDVVLFLTKPELSEGEILVTIAKHRNGPLTNFRVDFDANTTKFSDKYKRAA